VHLALTELRAPSGPCCGCLATAFDLTELRVAERALRQEKHLIDKIINSQPGLSYLFMPDMNGKELADRMRRRQPQLKVLFTSGYTADIIGRHGMLEPGVEFLPKPYSPVELARRVRQCLDAPG
jgi:CheY-like chemotaxis protein